MLREGIFTASKEKRATNDELNQFNILHKFSSAARRCIDFVRRVPPTAHLPSNRISKIHFDLAKAHAINNIDAPVSDPKKEGTENRAKDYFLVMPIALLLLF